jgi:hypothetical protein
MDSKNINDASDIFHYKNIAHKSHYYADSEYSTKSENFKFILHYFNHSQKQIQRELLIKSLIIEAIVSKTIIFFAEEIIL